MSELDTEVYGRTPIADLKISNMENALGFHWAIFFFLPFHVTTMYDFEIFIVCSWVKNYFSSVRSHHVLGL